MFKVFGLSSGVGDPIAPTNSGFYILPLKPYERNMGKIGEIA
jgi:hypothetical protein